MTTQRTQGFRPEIQALRAVAVLLVVINHIWPSVLSGGYVGVDVFFVISGFLITSHLLREIRNDSTVSLGRFWARRVRRLLPAACTVLLACIALTMFVLTPEFWSQNLREIIGSALYVENWLLVSSSVDYLAAENDASLVQHFWSLSVEEQFYIAWPLLFLLVVAVSARVARRNGSTPASTQPRYVLALLILVAIGGLVLSATWTSANPATAYFSTFTRVWEFAVGGLIALAPALRGRFARALHHAASWGGLALIAISALIYDGDTLFPGWAALLPVVGTALVIWAGDSDSSASPVWLGKFAPVQFVGDISYGVYLWHWPVVVMYPILRGNDPELKGGLAIVAASIVLAYLTKRFIEDPIRTGARWRMPRRSFALGAGVMSTVGGIAAVATVIVSSIASTASAAPLQFTTGAEIKAAVAETVSADRFAFPDQFPRHEAQVGEWVYDGCMSIVSEEDADRCTYGNSSADKRLVLIGDSFATHLLPALREYFGGSKCARSERAQSST